MDFLKHIEDFGKGVFDSVVTAPYVLGDFIARGTGFRDWQMGTGSYYMEQAKIETDLILTAITNTEAQKLLWEQIKSEVQEKPMYFLGGFILSNAISKGALTALETKGVTNEVKLFVYPKEMTTSLLLAKIDNSIHTLIKENPEFYNILKESGVLDTITEDNISSVLDNITSNPLNNFYSNEYKLLSDKLKDLSIATANNLADTKNIRLYDPVALDLNNNGKIDTITLENGVFFDHNGDKIAFKSSWIDGKDGLLARDIDNDGKITSGAELFGNFTKLKNGELAKNGAEALKDLDDNNDGVFDERDKAFKEILVWQDINSNGKAESGELKSLSEHGIKSINLEFLDDNTALDKDNKQILVGSFAINDSDEALASDIDFSVNSVERQIDESAGLIKGTGFVRDFKPELSKEIGEFYASYKELESKAEQIAATDELVALWAKTAKQYKELDNPIQKVKINISSVANGTTQSAINELIKRAEAGEITLSDGVMSDGRIITTNTSTYGAKSLTPGQALALYEYQISDENKEIINNLKEKIAIINVFSGKNNEIIYISNDNELTSAINNIEQAYNSIKDYTYKSLLVNTRLEKYAKNIQINMDFGKDDFDFKLDFGKVEAQLLDFSKSDSVNALIDYVEFNSIYEDKGLKEGAEFKLISKAFEAEKLSSALTLLDDGQKRMILVSTQKLLAESMAKSDGLSDESKKVADMLDIKVISANGSSSNGSAGSSLSGQNSNDIMLGSKGNDSLSGNNGDDTLNGDAGNDKLYGGDGNDTLNGGKGDDYLEGGRGNDTYVFGKDWGVDTIYNYDYYRTNDGSVDKISFIDGILKDDLEFSANSNHDLIIKMGDNKLTANNALATNSYYKISEIILGDEVLDYETIRELALSGTNEKQNIYGYADKENIINAGGGDDYIEGHNKNDTINAEGGNDTIKGYSGDDILNGGNGNDVLEGGDGNDTLNGDAGNDKLYGGDGDDTLNGGKGDDTLNGGRGNDTYVFGKDWGVDTIYNYDNHRTKDDSKDIIEFKDGIKFSDLSFSSNSNYDLIITQGNNKIIAEYALGDNYYKIDKVRFDDNTEFGFDDLRKSVLQGKDSTKNLYGFMDVENTINAGSDNNHVYGNSKDDILIGESGKDYLYGENGLVLQGKDSTKNLYGFMDVENTINAGSDNNHVYGSSKDDILNGEDRDDILIGESGNDYLYGENGDDILIGGFGNDYLSGGRGNDTYVFGKDWGVDTIYNYDNHRTKDDSKDIIEFKDGIKFSDLSFSSNSNYDLIITQGNNKIIAEYALGDNYYKIDKVRFDDNTEFGFDEINLLVAPKDEIA